MTPPNSSDISDYHLGVGCQFVNAYDNDKSFKNQNIFQIRSVSKGWLAIAKLKPLSLFISLLLMPKKAFDNVK